MERRAITVQGIVQGVGFRPFVYALASRLKLAGLVRNRVGGVLIEIEGTPDSLDAFLAALTDNPPPLAKIDALSWEPQAPRGEQQFRIESSEEPGAVRQAEIFIAPDMAACADCLAEMFDPADRRYRYPFLNCTNCGPRLTIVTGAPYDRERTTMANFAMCAACQAEYDDPLNRRFHAQPTCCPVCGPQLELIVSRPDGSGDPSHGSGKGTVLTGDRALSQFSAALRAGRIGALKGLGGYHLACHAEMAAAVAELRRRKHRDEKPFALMVEDAAAAERICEFGAEERALLLSPRRPIVLLRKRPGSTIADEVAPQNPFLGIMLPYTPLHHLLMHELRVPLVMTSGNRSDEPIAYEDDDACQRLAGIADVFLRHDRPIHVRCEDSVTRCVDGIELPLRRSRGCAPQPIALPVECPAPILAVGGQMKGTFALGRGRHAFVSHHLGDLDHYDAYCAFVEDIELYQELFGMAAAVVVHDLHPDYASTRYALERKGVQLLAVQHHHAHVASCMAEHGLVETVIGVSFDGTGYGSDGTVWGGEFLVGNLQQFRRAAHLRCVGMPGGDRAIKEPWRMALAQLMDGREDAQLVSTQAPAARVRTVQQMLERGFNTPLTSSAGRLFDAVAALAGVRQQVSFEGQAAMELEWLASGVETDGSYPFELREYADDDEAMLEVDTRPLIRAVVVEVRRGTEARLIARRFHSTLVEVIVAVCRRIRETTGLASVVLSGGVFMNVLLTREVLPRLQGEGFRVYRHQLVPPNDGGLSLGQLAIAAKNFEIRKPKQA